MGFFYDTFLESGIGGCFRKFFAALGMIIPPLLTGRRTNASVAAYFDLITDDGRKFYGDSFHFGYFRNGNEGMQEALDAHTDLVAGMARLTGAMSVLDIGCGLGAPAIRISRDYGCPITGINISGEQVRQGRDLVRNSGMSKIVNLRQGNALKLDFPADSFDALLCMEAAGDICVSALQKKKLVDEMYRVAKPGAQIGFSDLVFTGRPTPDEEEAMKMVLYHSGEELVTDWATLFRNRGFIVDESRDILAQTMPTWVHAVEVYVKNPELMNQRYGRKISQQTQANLRRIPAILQKHGSFVVLSLRKAAAA